MTSSTLSPYYRDACIGGMAALRPTALRRRVVAMPEGTRKLLSRLMISEHGVETTVCYLARWNAVIGGYIAL